MLVLAQRLDCKLLVASGTYRQVPLHFMLRSTDVNGRSDNPIKMFVHRKGHLKSYWTVDLSLVQHGHSYFHEEEWNSTPTEDLVEDILRQYYQALEDTQ